MMKLGIRLLSVGLVMALLLSVLPVTALAADVVASGTCGENLTWKLDENGHLTISGTGAMDDYTFSYIENARPMPWDPYWRDIKALTVEKGVTSIGNHAFGSCVELTHAEIGEDVVSIGDRAFHFCVALETISLPDGLREVGEYAFNGATPLKCVDFPDSVSRIGAYAFENSYVEEVRLPEGLTTLEAGMFTACTYLCRLYLPDSIQTIKECALSTMGPLVLGDLPAELTTIEASAFSTANTQLTIPRKVTFVDSNAFVDAGETLKAVYFEGSVPKDLDGSLFSPAFNYDPQVKTVWIYYPRGNTSWTKHPHYDAETQTWFGYPCAPWDPAADPGDLEIHPLNDNRIALKGGGRAVGLFRLTDSNGKPAPGVRLDYAIDGRYGSAVTDGNGIISVQTPAVTASKVYDVEFSLLDTKKDLQGAEQTIEVVLEGSAYEQSWKGSLGKAFSAGVGAGAGVAIGAAEAEASLIGLSGKAGMNGQYEIKDVRNGSARDLELTYTYGKSLGLNVNSGVDMAVLGTDIRLVDAKTGGKLVDRASIGLKIEDYDPNNLDQLLDVGYFNLLVAMTGNNSVWVSKLLELLDVSAHNQSAVSKSLIVSAGAGAGVVESSIAADGDVAVFSGDCESVISVAASKDTLNGTRKHTYEMTKENGFSVLDGFVPGGPPVFGDGESNSLELSASFDQSDDVEALTFKLYDEGRKDILWNSSVEETATEIRFGSESVQEMTKENEVLKKYVDGTSIFLSPFALNSAVITAASGEYDGTFERTSSIKNGLEETIPFGLNLGIKAKLELSGSFIHETGIISESGVYLDGDEYTVMVSDQNLKQIRAEAEDLDDILLEPINAVSEAVSGLLNEVVASVEEGVKTAWAEIESGAQEIWVSITEVFRKDEVQSYAILTLCEAAEEPTLAVTVGAPHMVAIYADEAGETPLGDEVLAEKPLTLKLSYDSAMLTEAGADQNSDIHMYWFDPEQNMYVLLNASQQDKQAMTVTAKITKQGEYILATDSAAPLIHGFELSDRTATPELTFYISDLSGIQEFVLWLDENEETPLLTAKDFAAHYEPESGVFTYAFETPLTAGAHTVSVRAADPLGNCLSEPITYSFVIDDRAPVISDVTAPKETVTDPDGFRITAKVSDETELSRVFLLGTSDTGSICSEEMVQAEDGVWTADVKQVAGVSQWELRILASDAAGNQSESPLAPVEVAVPELPDGMSVSAYAEGSQVTVSLTNHQGKAMSGWVICAVYTEDGQMLELGEAYIGLTANQSRQIDLELDTAAQSKTDIKVFVIDVNAGYIPVKQS